MAGETWRSVRSWNEDLAFLATPDQIQEIVVGAKRRRDNIFEVELSDPSIPKPDFLMGEPAPVKGPVKRPRSPSTIETEEVDAWDEESEITDPQELARLRPIFVNPSMTEFKGTSENAIIAKWHTLAAHINQRYLRQVAPRIEGMEELTRVKATVPAPICEACQRGKSKHKALPKKTLKRSTEPMHRMHADMSGHVRVPTVDGAHYFLLVLDDATGYKFVALLRTKDEFIDALNHLLIRLGTSMKILRIDNAGEMTSARAFEFYEAHRIWIEVCNAYEHFQSGRIESAIGSVSMRARVMLVSSGVPLTFWGFAVRYAVAIENRFLPTTPDSDITCFEAFHGKPPINTIVHPFGCLAFLHVDVNRRPIKKLSETSVMCVFLGFAHDLGHKGFLLKQLTKQRFYIAFRSVTFDHARFPYLKPVDPVDAPWAGDKQSLDLDFKELHEMEIDEHDESSRVNADNVEVILEDEEGVADEDNAMIPETEARRIQTRSMTREPSQGGSDVVITNDVSRSAINDQPERYEPEPEHESSQQQSEAVSEADSDDFQLKPSHRAHEAVGLAAMAKKQPSSLFRFSVPNAAALIGLCFHIGVAMTLNEPLSTEYNASLLQSVAYSAEGSEDPADLAEAMSRPDAAEWWACTVDEWQSFLDMGVFEEVDLPQGRRAIQSKLVYKLKRDEHGIPVRHKARIVARGFQQELGVDFFESFSAMSHPVHVRAIMALAAEKGWHTNQIDIKTAYLHGELEEEIFLTPPRGLEGFVKPGKVMRLRKAVYGLSQSGRVLWKKVTQTMADFGCKAASEDDCVFVYKRGDSTLIIATVVDDMIQVSDSQELIDEFNEHLKKSFIITNNGPIKFFLGVHFKPHPDGGFHANQTAQIERMLAKFGVTDESEVNNTPMVKGFTISESDLCENPDPTLVTRCKSILGSLTHIQLWSRPDVSYPVNLIARHVSKASPILLTHLKRILRYLNKTKHYGLRMGSVDPLGHGPKLTVYVDASNADCGVTRRSTGGYVVYYNGVPISWRSARQPLVTLSTAESEYVQATLACQEVVALRHLFAELGSPMDAPTVIYEDNKAAIDLSVNPCSRGRSKHIERRWHFVRQCDARKEIVLAKIAGELNPADLFTKALAYDKFDLFRRLLGVQPFAE